MILMRVHSRWLALASYFLTQSFAQNFTASTCVAANAFTRCVKQQDSFFDTCISNSGGDTNRALACGCVYQLGELKCAMTNCWNVVYGCEYQTLANAYTANCAGPVPFFPAPDNAPGGCSCNLGYALYNTTSVNYEARDCITGDIDRNNACICCEQAAGYAALYGICPNTSPDYVGYVGADSLLDVQDPNLKQGQCASAFAKYDCVSLGFTNVGVPFMTSYDAATLGTQSISNTNTKTLMSPASGATFVWTDLSILYTIVAASVNAGANTAASSSSKSSAGATVGGANSGSSAGSTGASAQSTTSAKSSAHQHVAPQFALTLLIAAAILVHVLD